jgi:uncharacterized protein (TIGR01777 family)
MGSSNGKGPNMKIALSGAGGFVGSALRKTFPDHIILERGDSEDVLLRKFEGVDAVINLAGAPIIRRWSDPYKKTLIESRIDTTEKIVNALNRSEVQQFISTSAVGIYPDGKRCDESCPRRAEDFLGQLAQAWEDEALRCKKTTAVLRFGVILGPGGGALKQMLTPFRLGVGGVIGNGKMMTSWIDIDDLMRIYRFVLQRRLDGIFNAVSPIPVTNRTLTKALGKVLHRPTVLPIPEFALRLMYGEAASVLTGSKNIYPCALEKAGFEFEYPQINQSLEHLLGN